VLANKIAEQFKLYPPVTAVAYGGSHVSGKADSTSDIDLYIFIEKDLPIHLRQKIVNKLSAKQAQFNLTFWDLNDSWLDADSGIELDVMYWHKTWIEEQIARVLELHLAQVGYSTCFWHIVSNLRILFDRSDWLANLQQKCSRPYPEKLKQAIIAKNHPILRNLTCSYYFQIKKALKRNDLISVNHRLSALLASYFDVLFAINCITNPGEKRILAYTLDKCSKLPQNLQKDIEEILQIRSVNSSSLLAKIDALLDAIDELLIIDGIDPAKTLFIESR
jgi:hypothetical protein